MPSPERYPRVFVLAPDYEWFVNWCHIDCDPPENPNDPKFVVCTSELSVLRRMAGWKWQEGDQVVRLSHYKIETKICIEFDRSLRMMGYQGS